ncbi:MAG: GGDEF domain-containing phosphodiesterase [Pseudomonadota bacterium]
MAEATDQQPSGTPPLHSQQAGYEYLERYFAAEVLCAQRYHAVLAVTLERYHTLIDGLGYPAALAVRQQVLQRVRECLREGACAELGDQQIVVILPVIGPYQGATHAARHILDALAQPFYHEDLALHLNARIGISLFPEDAQDFATLARYASIAAHDRGAHRDEYMLFRADMAATANRFTIGNILRDALSRREFTLHYQPKVRLDTRMPAGVEALLRWHHPDSGAMPPERLIALLDDAGLLMALGEWVLDQACRDQARWREAGIEHLPVAVNLAPAQFHHPDLAGMVRHTLDNHSLPTSALELEITESGMMSDPNHTLVTLRFLREMGVRISIDDFGTGYSSLSYLQRFPINHLKIDQSFLHNIPADPNDTTLVEAILAMSRSLGLEVIAEGVERAQQADFLQSRGCEFGQGYLFSQALEADEIIGFARRHSGG